MSDKQLAMLERSWPHTLPKALTYVYSQPYFWFQKWHLCSGEVRRVADNAVKPDPLPLKEFCSAQYGGMKDRQSGAYSIPRWERRGGEGSCSTHHHIWRYVMEATLQPSAPILGSEAPSTEVWRTHSWEPTPFLDGGKERGVHTACFNRDWVLRYGGMEDRERQGPTPFLGRGGLHVACSNPQLPIWVLRGT